MLGTSSADSPAGVLINTQPLVSLCSSLLTRPKLSSKGRDAILNSNDGCDREQRNNRSDYPSGSRSDGSVGACRQHAAAAASEHHGSFLWCWALRQRPKGPTR